MSDRQFYLYLGILFFLFISLPYLAAFIIGGEEFGGFLLNPIDGQSYLAKIGQGMRGQWRFTLPYTDQPGSGAYLFLFYICLGHFADLIGTTSLAVFHISRLIGAGLMFWAMLLFFKSHLADRYAQRLAFSTALLGSGLGWTAVLLGFFTSDFWVAEAYPFLSAYTNPHFTWGLALMLCMLAGKVEKMPLVNLGMGAVLALIQPFGVVLVILVQGALFLEMVIAEGSGKTPGIWKNRRLQSLILAALGAGGLLLYQYLVIRTDPVLSQWNRQNITSSPEMLDLWLSFSPALILAGAVSPLIWRERKKRIFIFWAGIGLLLIFIPWSLQRRFLTGLYIPLAGLSAAGISWIKDRGVFRHSTLIAVWFLLILPTNVIILTSGMQAVITREETIFAPRDFTQVLAWINENTSENDLILAGTRESLYIPPETGRRVIYGHPFETVQAAKEEAFVEDFMAGRFSPDRAAELIFLRDINYLVVEEERPVLPMLREISGLQKVHQGSAYQIFRVVE